MPEPEINEPEAQARPPVDVVLGVDYGQARVGLALGLGDSGLVLGLPVLRHPGKGKDKELARQLVELVRERRATVVVLGLPLHRNGAVSAGSRAVEALKALMAELDPGLRIELEDERLTSASAEADLRDKGLRWWQIPKGTIDTAAAIEIARTWMGRKNPALFLRQEEETAPEPDPPAAGGDSRAARRRAARRGSKRRMGGDDDEGEEG